MEKSTENPKKNQINPNNPKTRLILKEFNIITKKIWNGRRGSKRSDVTKDDQRQ